MPKGLTFLSVSVYRLEGRGEKQSGATLFLSLSWTRKSDCAVFPAGGLFASDSLQETRIFSSVSVDGERRTLSPSEAGEGLCGS